ncbi:MAG: ATP-binding protein [Leptospira sp.]|nr:ATP-binding protein [Leptospira sp.]
MHIDPLTIIIVNLIGSFLMGTGLYLASRGHLGKLSVVRSWSYATLIQSLGWVILGVLRGKIPDIISIVIGNATLLFSLIYYLNIIRIFFGKKPLWLFGCSLVLFEIIGLLIILHSDINQKFRISLISAFAAIPLLGGMYEIIEKKINRTLSNLYTSIFFSACGILLIYRVYYYSFFEVESISITFGPSKIQDLTYLSFYITSVMLTFGFIMMCIDRFVNEQIESEDNYRLLAENSSDVIWVYDLILQRYTYISPSIYQLRGLRVKEAMQESFKDSFTLSSYTELIEKIDQRTKEFRKESLNKLYFTDEVSQLNNNKQIIWVELITSIQIGKNGNLEILGVSRNIDSRKQIEKDINKYLSELESLNSTKDKFLSIIAHDLKAPIGGIHTFVSMILEEIDEQDLNKTKMELSLLEDASKEVLSLLDNLLTWARSQKGELSFDLEVQSLYTITQRCIQVLSFSAENKEIQLQNEIPINQLIYADQSMLETILRNLISNAIKYTRANGIVKITAKQNIDNVQITVNDTGIGMNAMTASKLFKLESKQASMPGTKGERGTGLGLILCNEFVNRHNGSIWVESELGVGSSFHITIPNKI